MKEAAANDAMLAEMSACAHRLGMAFGREAERTGDWGRKLELFKLFDRCFFSLRVAIALRLRLAREPAAGAARRPGDVEDLPEREERPLRPESDRDRDRETEPASLPVLVTTLREVAAAASALPAPRPAELATLQELIAQATKATGPAPPSKALRTRLAGSAAGAVATLGRPGPLATGPPRSR